MYRGELSKSSKNINKNGFGRSWTFVYDNLNIHKSESLVRFVIETCDIDNLELREKGKSDILKNMKSHTAFPHVPSHRIWFVFTPKLGSWRSQIKVGSASLTASY